MKKVRNRFISLLVIFAVVIALAFSTVLAACSKSDSGDGDDDDDTTATTGNTYYVTADAAADGDGSEENPYRLADVISSYTILKAGDTVLVQPGTYVMTNAIHIVNSGSYSAPITIKNASADSDAMEKVTLDFSSMAFDGSNRGISIDASYIYWYGIDIMGAGDNGMYISGSYNTIENCEFYNNRDTGLQLGRRYSEQTSIEDWPSYNLIKNCTSHNNYDNETYGENADGFAAKLTVGYGNVFDGCIAYRNSDDGWDLYAKTDSGNIGAVIIYNCVAFENGYLEYTQAECNALFPTYDGTLYDEADTNAYTTRDGDGNGFKLGGSVMEGDVVMYNCLSFNNRMHGVTDNSNPGYLKIENVTSADNSAAIDSDSTSDTFGQVISASNSDTHGNIDVARQTYSYNTLINVLSAVSAMPKSLDADAYRGSVTNSVLYSGSKTNVVEGSIDADTKNSGGKTYTSQEDLLSAEDIFNKIAIVKTTETVDETTTTSYTYNLSGLKSLGSGNVAGESSKLNAGRPHIALRNSDGSLNLGELYAVKSSVTLIDGVTVGATLNLSSWEAYTHFDTQNITEEVHSETAARLMAVKAALTINCDENICYQDFEVPIKMSGCTISWSSSDTSVLAIGTESEVSVSASEYITVGVTRPTDADKTVTLTATISYLNVSVTKTFTVKVAKDEPSIGTLQVRVAETGETLENGDSLILDQYRQYSEPALEVTNGASYSGKLLASSQYEVETTYLYAISDSSDSSDWTSIACFTPNIAGVYKITHTVTLADGSTKDMTYKIFVASTTANVDFSGSASVSVYLNGYIIAGDLNNVTGYLYTVASTTDLGDTLTKDNIAEYDGVEKVEFRATSISESFANDNSGAYYIYYALGNISGSVTSELYSAEVSVVEINTAADFVKVASGSSINSENVSQTIYMMTADIDCTDVTWSSGTFTGLLNGNGHTVSNVTIDKGSSTDAAIFKTVTGGTIMNIKFDNITLTTTGNRVGIVGSCYGGYFYNIAITNIYCSGAQRVGGLIGHVFEGNVETYIEQVSLINSIGDLDSTGALSTADGATATEYYISSSGNRAAGIIGFIQNSSTDSLKGSMIKITVSNCQVISYIYCGGYSVSSIVGEYNDNGLTALGYEMTMTIDNCYAGGILVSVGTGRMGGMLGYHNGAGTLTVSKCLSFVIEYYKGEQVIDTQKNQSGIIGNYSTSATVSVSLCYSLREEYNSDYGVSVLEESGIADSATFSLILGVLGFDTEAKWSLVYKEGSTTVCEAPYLSLNYLTSTTESASE